MRKIKLIWPGKTREPFLKAGIEKYLKLLTPYTRVEIIEVREGRGRDQNGVIFESENILKIVKNDFILLDAGGSSLSSEEFAAVIRDSADIEFALGGAFGVSEKVRKKAKKIISLSRMTFTHEMSRLFLLEQIYRAITIIQGREYHH